MKRINKYFASLLVAVLISGLLTVSCNKASGPEPEPVVPKGTFMLHMHTYIDNTEVDLYNINYATLQGRKISLNMAQLYISDVQLVKLDGTTVNISGKKVLKVFETDTYTVGDVPVGNYKSFRFKVGLDPATNALNATTPSDSALLNKPSMWLGNTPQPDGYVFMNVQGKIDTSSTLDKPQIPFTFKIGTNANYKQVTMGDKNFTVEEGLGIFGHVIIDFNRLFNGVQLNKLDNLNISNAALNASAIGTQIANNIPSMFIYE
ncbi:MAG: MbnP family protein [Saprospiraceae bacterium]